MGMEKNFENKVKKYLKEQNAWFIKYWGGGAFTKSGIPDLLCCVNGYFVAVELKAPNGKVSEIQKHVINKINEAGGIAIALYPKDYETFKSMIKLLNQDEWSAWDLRDQINASVGL